MRLSDIHSANYRARHPKAMQYAAKTAIPHPLNNVQYADGISLCRHAKRHVQFDLCQQEVRATVAAPSSQVLVDLEPRISSKRVQTHTAERFVIELPTFPSQAELDYAIAELRLFQVEHDGEDADPAEITSVMKMDGSVTVSFPATERWGGTDWNCQLWPNARAADEILAARGIVKPA